MSYSVIWFLVQVVAACWGFATSYRLIPWTTNPENFSEELHKLVERTAFIIGVCFSVTATIKLVDILELV